MRIFSLTLFFIAMASPAWAENYLMLGLHGVPAAGKNWVCWDIAMDTQPLKSKAEYRAASKDYYQSHKGQSPFTQLLTPDKAAVVFKYRIFVPGWNCEHDVHSIQTGHDVAAAKKNMEKRRREKPREFRSDPQVVLTWQGSEYKSAVTKNYGGVEITYTSRRGRAGKTIVTAKGKNTNRDKAASVTFSGRSVAAKTPIVLQPGVGFSQTVGEVDGFDVDVGFAPPAEQGKNTIDAGIEYTRDRVRDHLKVRDEGLKSDGVAIGVRG